MFDKLIARQLGRPHGPLGLLVAREMTTVNQLMNRVSVEALAISDDHRVLDAGFGGGATLPLMAGQAKGGRVVGLELSDTMLRRARRRHRELRRTGRLQLVKGSLADLPFQAHSFDRICTVNTIYFLPDPQAALRELWRVLQPGGRLALTFRPAARMRELAFVRHGFSIYEPEAITDLLTVAGFSALSTHHYQDGFLGFVCTLAERPSPDKAADRPGVAGDLVQAA